MITCLLVYGLNCFSTIHTDYLEFRAGEESHCLQAIVDVPAGTDLPPLIFIHVGDDKDLFPSYLSEAVRQAARWNPTTHILVVLAKVFIDDSSNPVAGFHSSLYSEDESFWKDRVELVAFEDIPNSPKLAHFMNISTLDQGFRGGFWRKTTERLFVLAEVMRHVGIKEAFHMENDNMLYGRFTELLPTMRTLYPSLATTFIGGGQATAGLLYVRQRKALNDFLDFVMENPGLNDMESLWVFATKYGRNRLALLPADPTPTEFTNISDVHQLKTVFDGASYGQILGGTDNGHPPGFVNSRSDVANYRLKWDIEPVSGLRRPYVALKDSSVDKPLLQEMWTPIFNLHIHCKRLHLFAS